MGARNKCEDDDGGYGPVHCPVKPIERTLEDCFERSSNSRFAFGDREAAALRADLDFVVRSERCSAMRTMGRCRWMFKWLLRPRITAPEAGYTVKLEANRLSCERPDGTVEQIEFDKVASVFVETNDSGPWGIDVWWILNTTDGAVCRYPLGATGEAAVTTALHALPGFEVRGMDSAYNAQFECWPNPG
jgi:hypothetical protein